MNEITDGFIITKKFKNATDFSLFIENKVLDTKVGYMDCIISYCEEADIDVESITKLISISLKEKIRSEAEELNFLKPKAKLPL